MKFPVNDILLKLGRFNDIFVPINKHGGQAKKARITSYNVCYTKLLRIYRPKRTKGYKNLFFRSVQQNTCSKNGQ